MKYHYLIILIANYLVIYFQYFSIFKFEFKLLFNKLKLKRSLYSLYL